MPTCMAARVSRLASTLLSGSISSGRLPDGPRPSSQLPILTTASYASA